MRRFLFLLSFVFILSVVYVSAEISYPVSELGNCASKTACEAYCDDMTHIDECLGFAEKNNLMTPQEIAEARKFAPLMKQGLTPGGCKNQRECDAYCNNEANINECVDFAVKAGIISAEEAEMVKKTGGKGPGGCKGKEECDQFCNNDANFQICVDFAVANGLMPASEAELAKKTGGKGPGGCKGKEECDAFCQKEENIQTCIDFAVQYGLMDAKDAEMQRKTGGKGPGGCKGQEECDKFCSNPDNMETCTNFAIEYGLMSPEETEKMKKNLEWMKSSEGQCYSQCMKNSGISFKDCGENGQGPSACKECGEKCYSNDNYGNCLSQEKWQQLDSDCKSKGEGYYLQEVRGDSGQGKECVVDEICVQGTQPGTEKGCMDCASQCREVTGQRMTGTDCVDNQCKCIYEQIQVEREEQIEQGPMGGCTEPGPEGQCNPGPGAGSEGGGGSEPGDYVAPVVVEEGSAPPSDGGSGGGVVDSGGDSGSGSEGSSGGESSGGGDAGVTGAVILNGELSGLYQKIKSFFKTITGKVVQSFGPSDSDIQCMSTCMKCVSPGVGCTGNSAECQASCNVVKPEQTAEEKCVETCAMKGCGEFDFECQGNNQEICDKECGMVKEPPAKSEEEQCIRDCVNAEQEGLICGGGEGGEKGGELCQRCAKSCEHLYAGPCLDELKLENKKSECMTCEHCYAKPVMGDSGEGYDCIVNVECADSSGEFGDNPGTGEGIAASVGNAVSGVIESIGNFISDLFGGEPESSIKE